MNILDIKMQTNDAGAETIRDYLKKLLRELWSKGESFSGKRPFGNSDWERDLYFALAKAGVIRADFSSDDELIECDEYSADTLIFEAIGNL